MIRIGKYPLAVGTALTSKLGTIATQLIALPLVASSLGVEGFALYTMLISAAGWLAFANLGIAPTLAIEVAYNLGNNEKVRTLFSTALAITIILAGSIGIVSLVVIIGFPVQALFGARFTSESETIQQGLAVMVVAFVFQALLALVEAVEIGGQRQHRINIASTFGAVPTILAVVVSTATHQSLATILASTTLTPMVVRALFAFWAVFSNKAIAPRLSSVDAKVTRHLLSSGSIYSAAGTIGSFLAHVLPTMIVGRSHSPAETATFATTMTLVMLMFGIPTMIVTPAMPTVTRSSAEGNDQLLNKTYSRLLLATMGVAALVALVIGLGGQSIMAFWMRSTVSPSNELLIWAAVYFVVCTWEFVHFNILTALRSYKLASGLVFGRTIVGCLLTLVFADGLNSAFVFAAMSACILIINAVPLYVASQRRLRSRCAIRINRIGRTFAFREN